MKTTIEPAPERGNATKSRSYGASGALQEDDSHARRSGVGLGWVLTGATAAILAFPTASASQTQLQVVVTMSDFEQLEFLEVPVDPPGSGLPAAFDPIEVRFNLNHDFDTLLEGASGAPSVSAYQLVTTPHQGQPVTHTIDYSPGTGGQGLNNPDSLIYHIAEFSAPAGTLDYQIGFFLTDLGGSPSLFGIEFREFTQIEPALGLSSLWVPNNVTVSTSLAGDTEAQLTTAIADAGLTGEDAELDASPYGDGVPNLLKFAFNMNLESADARTLVPGGESGLPRISNTGSGASSKLQLSFLRMKNSDLVYSPQKTSGLDNPSSWAPILDAEPEVTSINDEWELVVYEEPYDPETTPRMFARVLVELPPSSTGPGIVK